MMRTEARQTSRDEFKRSAAWRREQHFMFEKRVKDRKREEREDRVESDISDFAGAVMMATDEQIAEFTLQLDHYDEATVKALYENEQALDAVKERIEDMLARAYVLPDGRRVFKTEDGLRVFDENGTELDASVIDPDQIEDYRPRWEAFHPETDLRDSLIKERSEILKFQEHLVDARDRIAEGDLTVDDLDELEAGLKADAPEAVLRHMPGYEPAQALDLQSNFTASAKLATDTIAPKPDEYALPPI